MTSRTSLLIHAATLAVLLAFVPATSASGQVFTGRIDLQITDTTGAVLPGVTVELTGAQTATAVTDEQGQAHFLNLQPGLYDVRATLSGFRDFRAQNVRVVAGGSVPLRFTLSVGGVAEQVEVIGGNTDGGSEAHSPGHQRHARRAAEHPVLA